MKKTILSLCILIAIFIAFPVRAKGVSMIRDAEIEKYLRDIASPVFKAAGLDSDRIKIYIVNSPVLNAFVAGGQNMFIHTGLILESDDPLLLTGVIAHESGHIAGGHLIRKMADTKNATLQATLGYILGIGSIIAGAPPEAATAIAAGGQHLAQSDFLKHSRQHEESADQAAINYLRKVKVSPRGLLALLEKLGTEQTLHFGSDINPYNQTHPLSSERISHIQHAMEVDKSLDVPASKNMTSRHRLIVAKLRGFLNDPEKIIEEVKDDKNVFGRYTKAVAYYRLPNLDKALLEINLLIKAYPKFPYFHELKGQMLYENGKIIQAIRPYKKALSLLPNNPLLQLELSVALLALDDDYSTKEAIKYLNYVVTKERENIFAWFQLGIAYGKIDNLGLSYLALAQQEIILNKNKEAKAFILKAKEYMDEDSPGFLRAQDLLDSIDKAG